MTAVDPSAGTVTVEPSAWGPLMESSPIMFGATAAGYGLMAGVPYYVASTPTRQIDPTTKHTTYTFRLTTKWFQQLSALNVPIQGTTDKSKQITFVPLTNPGGTVNLQWGPIQPVSQLGSQQLTSGKLAKNADGSVTIWIAPTLPPGAPATNWLPTPSIGVLREYLPRSKRADAAPIDGSNLLSDTRKRHTSLDTAATERIVGSHVQIPDSLRSISERYPWLLIRVRGIQPGEKQRAPTGTTSGSSDALTHAARERRHPRPLP